MRPAFRRRAAGLILAGGALLAGAVAPARADEAAEPASVVVTAPGTTPLDLVPEFDRTDVPLADIPRSIQVAPRALFEEQGAVQLTEALRDVSGTTQGGQFAFGFFDRVIIRGLNANYFNDGLPEGTSDLTGLAHSLVGVERVEVLKGPGSALFGASEPGGSINLVHYRPSDRAAAGLSEQVGSFGASTTDIYLTGPTGLKALDYRIDGEYGRTDGFRGQAGQTGEVLASLSWRPSRHDVEARFEYHHIDATPDAVGIPFSPPAGAGLPLAVPTSAAYDTPYAFADQDIGRLFLTDAWRLSDVLTLNLRSSLSARDVDLARNSGGSVKLVAGDYALASRQLREQTDRFGDGLVQIEPTFRFDAGGLRHVLVVGFEAREISGETRRATADLPNVANVFQPVVADPPLAALVFKCDASHSCDDARLGAQFTSAYLIDQIEVTPRLKLRLSLRNDWFRTEASALALVPVNGGQERPCSPPAAQACPLAPGAPLRRRDVLASADVGAVYVLAPGLSAYAGYSDDAYPIFNTEEPESVGQTPERGTQSEGGLRLQAAPWVTLSTSIYRTTRDHVFTFLVEPSPTGVGNVDVAQTFAYRVQGWEGDLDLRPAPRLDVVANFALQDGAITSYPQTPADLGHKIPSVPSLIANLWTSWAPPVPQLGGGFGSPEIFGGVRYRNGEFADAAETRRIPGAALVDAGFSLPWRRAVLRFGVQNLFDRRDFLYAAGTGGGAYPGPGRTLFARISASLW